MYLFISIADKSILEKVLDSYKTLPAKLVNQQGELPHHLAVSAHTDHSEAVLQVLRRYPFDLSTKNISGLTALQCCNGKRKKYKKYLEVEEEKVTVSVSPNNAYDHKKSKNKASVQLENTKDDHIENSGPKGTSEAAKHIDDVEPIEDSKLHEHIKKEVDDILCKPEESLFPPEKGSVSSNSRPPDRDAVDATVAHGTTDQVATTSTTDMGYDESKQDENWLKSLKDCAWEVECTETFWKELAKQNETLKKNVTGSAETRHNSAFFKFHFITFL